MTLIQCEYIWQVVYQSINDEYIPDFIDSYWTNLDQAEKRAREVNGRCNQTCLWRDNANNYYQIEYKEVIVDPPTKEAILAKLTPKERKILGV